MNLPYRVGFIGAGNMAQAIINGVIQKELYHAEEIIVSNRSFEKVERLHKDLGVVMAKTNQDVAQKAQIVVIAVKPQQFNQVVQEISQVLTKETIVVSIMAGITTDVITKALKTPLIIRTMPNTPAQIGYGMTAICATGAVKAPALAEVERIFASTGECLVVEEHLMDAIGAISGSGPAYVYQMIEALADGGVMVGLPRAMAYQLAAQTMVGAGAMFLQTGMHPGALKDMVTSPGGTTIKALAIMEERGVRSALIGAVEAAYLKSQQLGEVKKSDI